MLLDTLLGADIEKACIAKGLQLLKTESALGGKTKGGFGRVQIEIDTPLNSFLYDDYLKEHKAAIMEYLNNIGAFASQEEKEEAAAKKANKKKPAKKPAETPDEDTLFTEAELEG